MKKYLNFTIILVACLLLNLTTLKAQTVYITENGKKFHAKNCTLVPKGKKGLELSVAKTKGYTACARCKADDIKPSATESKKAKTKGKPKK